MLARALATALALVGASAADAPRAVVPGAGAASIAGLSPTKLLGQRIMVGMDGTSPSRRLLADVRAGRVGSVILFRANIVSRSQLQALTRALQQAARAGGNPRLLIATDQEGGQVKRLPNGPPSLSPPQIAARGSTSLAYAEGRSTGNNLKGLGINWDLAPVVDVPTFSGAFIWRQGRAFSFSAAAVSRYASAFALGLQSARTAAAAKHFPGVGSAGVDTDNQLDELHPSPAQRAAALAPYQTLVARGLDSVMVSTAGFPAYDRSGTPAALSRTIIQGLLRGKLGFDGVAITDALGTPTGHGEVAAGVLAARAGADVLLYTDSAPGVLGALIASLRHGQLTRAEAAASYARIAALKRSVGGG